LIPFISVNIGFWLTVLPLEFILQRVLAEDEKKSGSMTSWRYWFRPVDYSPTKTRKMALDECRSKISFVSS
jgi:hypothetical protein